jgi:hypothetical protein
MRRVTVPGGEVNTIRYDPLLWVVSDAAPSADETRAPETGRPEFFSTTVPDIDC